MAVASMTSTGHGEDGVATAPGLTATRLTQVQRPLTRAVASDADKPTTSTKAPSQQSRRACAADRAGVELGRSRNGKEAR